jgi:hypothetical protein
MCYLREKKQPRVVGAEGSLRAQASGENSNINLLPCSLEAISHRLKTWISSFFLVPARQRLALGRSGHVAATVADGASGWQFGLVILNEG